MSNFYPASGLIGGGVGKLDSIDGAILADGDAAIVITDGNAYLYHLDATSAAGESSPQIIAPDDNPGDKRWILSDGTFEDLTVFGAIGCGIINSYSSNATASFIAESASDFYSSIDVMNSHADDAGDADRWRHLMITRKTGGYSGLPSGAYAIRKLGDTDNFWLIILPDGKVCVGGGIPDCKLRVDGAIASKTLTFSTEGPTDNLDVSGVNVIHLDCSSNDVTIGGLVGGVDGQVLYLAKLCAGAYSAILEHNEDHANQKLFLHAGGDEELDTEYGGWVLTCDGTHWYDASHSAHV